MPGSLNYSPSGSEGGGSLGGGGADLERSLVGVDLTTTPGTTPLKWRQKSASGSSGVPVASWEGSWTPATKTTSQGQDRVPPKIEARKSSSDATKGTGSRAELIDDPARLRRKPPGTCNATGGKGAIDAPSVESSILQRTSFPLSSSSAVEAAYVENVDHEKNRGSNLRDSHSEVESLLAAGNDVQKGRQGVDCELGEHILDLSATGDNPREQGDSIRAGKDHVAPQGEAISGDAILEATKEADSVPIDGRISNALVHGNNGGLGNVYGDTLGGAKESQQQLYHESPAPSRRASRAAEEVAAALVEKLAAPVHDGDPDGRTTLESQEETPDELDITQNNKHLAENGIDNARDINGKYRRESRPVKVEMVAALSGGTCVSGDDVSRYNSVNVSRSTSLDIHSRGTYPQIKIRQVSSDAAEERTNDLDVEGDVSRKAFDVCSLNAAVRGSTPCDSSKYRRLSQDEAELATRKDAHQLCKEDATPVSNERSVVAAPGDPATCVSSRVGVEQMLDPSDGRVDRLDADRARRGGGGMRRGGEGERGVAGGGGVENDSRRWSHPSTESQREGETRDLATRPRMSSLSSNLEVVQSPPRISRRKKSGRVAEQTLGLHKSPVDKAGESRVREGGPSTRGPSVREGSETEAMRLDSSGNSNHEASSTGGPPLRTPRMEHPARREERATPTSAAVPPTPSSPVAEAARAISLEESVRSTQRMKRAAEAIAREDAQKSANAAEREAQRTQPSGHRVAKATNKRNTEPEHHALEGEVDEGDRAQGDDVEREARHAEKMRARALRALTARGEAEIERDRALALTLEVLRRRHANNRRGVRSAELASGRKRAHSPPRKSKRPEDHRTSLATRVKDSAARSCGLSPAQVLLLRRSRQLGHEDGKRHTASNRRAEDLAQPKEGRPATRNRNPETEGLVEELTRAMTDREKRAFLHACLEDAKECTHRPYTRTAAARRARGGQGGDAGEGEDAKGAFSSDAFICRMEAQERAKAAAMEHRRGELAYKAILDKRVCPRCGAEQSYDEVQEKRKTCPNCEVQYRRPKTWSGVKKDFLDRVETFQEMKQESLQAAIESQDRKIRTLALGGRHGGYGRDPSAENDSDSETEERERLYWEDVEDDFISRLREDATRRQATLESRHATMHQNWTFQPTLSGASERVVGDSAWAGLTFMERMEGDLQRRREVAPPPSHGTHATNKNDSLFGFGDTYDINT